MGEPLSIRDVAALCRRRGARASSEKSIRNAVKAGQLARQDDGFFDSDAVDAWLVKKATQLLDEDDGDDDGVDERKSALEILKDVVGILRDGYAQSTRHAETLMKLVEGYVATGQNTLKDTNTELRSQVRDLMVDRLDWQKLIGDLLMRKEEALAVRETAKERSSNLKMLGMAGLNYLPTLMQQAAGQRALSTLLSKVTPRDKEFLWMIHAELETEEAKRSWVEMLKKLGVEQPKKEESKNEPTAAA